MPALTGKYKLRYLQYASEMKDGYKQYIQRSTEKPKAASRPEATEKVTDKPPRTNELQSAQCMCLRNVVFTVNYRKYCTEHLFQ